MNVPLQYYAVIRKPNALEAARDRVRKEASDLDTKYQALDEFLNDPQSFNRVDSKESGLLYEQRNAMKHYREALKARIAYWEEE